MTIYSLDVLLSQFGTIGMFQVCCSMSGSNCCFLTSIWISQKAGKVVYCSHLLKNFPQFVLIHTGKGFGIDNKADVDVFLELSCFFNDPADVGNLISGSSDFSKTSLNIWVFIIYEVLKPGLETFELYFASVWDEYNYVVQFEHSLALPFFGIGMKTDLFQSCGHWCGHLLCLDNLVRLFQCFSANQTGFAKMES